MELGGCHIPAFVARKGMLFFHGEEPRGRACSLSSPLGRSLCSCEAGGGWGAPWGRSRGGIAGSGFCPPRSPDHCPMGVQNLSTS